MEDGRTSGRDQALRCVAAMEGQDELTKLSLWKAALRYRRRDTHERPGGLQAVGGSLEAWTMG